MDLKRNHFIPEIKVIPGEILMEVVRAKIKDVERLQKYERIFSYLLKKDIFSRADIWRCGENKKLIGKVINNLISEGTIDKKPKGFFEWESSHKEKYKAEWLDRDVSTHQLRRLSKDERPREKLLTFGPSKLTTSELLAIFLRVGTKGKSVVNFAGELLNRFGGVRGIFEAPNKDLLEIRGIGKAKVAQIKAVQALAEQYLKERVTGKPIRLKSSKAVFDYLYQSMAKETKEVFKVFYLDDANNVLDIEDVFQGTVDQGVIYPREVIKSALDKNATRLILAHNHLSGILKPSGHDIEITRQLKKSCAAVSLEILDHTIIGKGQYYSFREHGLLG